MTHKCDFSCNHDMPYVEAASVAPSSIDYEAIGQAYGVAPEVVELIIKAGVVQPVAASVPTGAASVRDAFEQRLTYPETRRSESTGRYLYSHIESDWKIWQEAARALQGKPEAPKGEGND